MVRWYDDKGGKALAEPHGDVSVHVDGEGLEALLEAAHGVVLKSAGVLAQVHMTDLRHAQTAHGDETCREGEGTFVGLPGTILVRQLCHSSFQRERSWRFN